jgi:hypothetical protein
MDLSCERSNLSFQNQRLKISLSNPKTNPPIRRKPDLVQPATLRCLIHIKFIDAGKGLFDFFMSAARIRRAFC